MKTKAFKLAALLLALCAALAALSAMLSATAAAGEVCEVAGVAKFLTVEAALAAVESGQTVRLLQSTVLESSLVIDSGKTFALDTNGKTLDFDGWNLYIQDGSKVAVSGCDKFVSMYVLSVSGAQTRVLLDGSLTLGGSLLVEAGQAELSGSLTSGVLGVGARDGAQVSIGGSLSAPAYILLETTEKAAGESAAVTTKEGCRTYTDGVNTVWVKDLTPPQRDFWDAMAQLQRQALDWVWDLVQQWARLGWQWVTQRR